MIYLSVSQHRLTIRKVRAVGFKIKIVVRIIYQYNYQPLGVELERKIKKYITIRTNIENLQGIGAFSGQISLQFEVVDADCVTVLINCNDDEPLPGACQLLETSLLPGLDPGAGGQLGRGLYPAHCIQLSLLFMRGNLFFLEKSDHAKTDCLAWPSCGVGVAGSGGNVACL